MKGNCIAILGLSGSGKSTMTSHLMKNLKNIQIAKTYTTREKRNNEINPLLTGYVFVSENEYMVLKNNSNNWSHTEIYGNYYGGNLEKILIELKKGKNIIFNFYPDKNKIVAVEKKLNYKIWKVFIDVPKEITESRIKNEREFNERHRIKVEENILIDEVKDICDCIFYPKGDVVEDSKLFLELINNKINLDKN